MNTGERLTRFILYKGLSMSEFQRICGLGNGYVSKITDSIGKRGLSDILRKFPELNGDWLLHGEGEMLKPVVQTANANGESSVAAVNIQNVTMESEALKEQVRLLKDIIAEKERIITLLMESRNKQ